MKRILPAVAVLLAALSAIGAGSPAPQFPTIRGDAYWIAGPADTILMLYDGADSKGHVDISTDAGLAWRTAATFDHGVGPVTRLADGSLVMVIHDGDGRRGWISSADDGGTWSQLTPIPIEFRNHVYSWGPIIEMTDGRWAYCPYAQNGNLDANALIVWSNDRGRTWSDPIAFPTPVDGNMGLTEVTLVQVGTGDYLAAIRSDDVENGGFDGFYFSRSHDGLTWSKPEPIGDIGRQPHFFRLDDCWALTYRQWVPQASTNFSAMRFSRNGRDWSRPYRVQQSVQDGASLVRAKGQLIAFNQLYPQHTVRTRHGISIPAEKDWFDSDEPKMLEKK